MQEGGFAGTATRHAGAAVKPSQRGGFYGLRPLPPAPLVTGHSEDCVGCWFGYVVNFICKAFVEIDLKNDIIV